MKHVLYLGIHILGTSRVKDKKFLHAASVLAEYLDKDQDGTVNNTDILNNLKANKAAMVITYNENELESIKD